jgi:GNAT superfamily N-acetyltransferase
MWQQQVPSHADTVSDFVEFAAMWLEDRRYTLNIDADMTAWARAMASAPGMALVNPTFDPRWSPLSPANSFWLDIRAGSRTVAMIAARLFVTDDYLELMRSTRLWYDRPSARLPIEVPEGTPAIRGSVGHEGGLWVDPEHRKRGFSVILPHLVRAFCHREWHVDWQTGATMRGIGESGIAVWAYGAPHLVPCYEGYFPVTGHADRLFLVYMSEAELVAGLDLGRVARLLPDRHREMGHAAVRVQKG